MEFNFCSNCFLFLVLFFFIHLLLFCCRSFWNSFCLSKHRRNSLCTCDVRIISSQYIARCTFSLGSASEYVNGITDHHHHRHRREEKKKQFSYTKIVRKRRYHDKNLYNCYNKMNRVILSMQNYVTGVDFLLSWATGSISRSRIDIRNLFCLHFCKLMAASLFLYRFSWLPFVATPLAWIW